VKQVRILYRVRQFWRTMFDKIDPHELERMAVILVPEQAALFSQLQQDEQKHAMLLVRKLTDQGDNQPDLLVAALLHDVGKLRYRMNPFERSLVVLVKAFLPMLARRWGSLPLDEAWDALPGWRKPFVLAAKHAEWGAAMARKSGVSHLTETLIREHHHPHVEGGSEVENDLLHKLWVVDNDS
jgi:putative nucleotidyltransferase with HDIG domain